ncbi:MAG: hypothetical protein M5U26_22560 [Planctomycetota bacterium]|nr:hypothetical protein [Planctomycetota bacterium]
MITEAERQLGMPHVREAWREWPSRRRGPAPVDLSDVVDEVLLIAAPLARDGMRFSVTLAMETLPVEMDYKLLAHVVFDLMRFVEAHALNSGGGHWRTVKVSTYRKRGPYCREGVMELRAVGRTCNDGAVEDGEAMHEATFRAIADLVERRGGCVEFRRDAEWGTSGIRVMLGLPLQE